MARIHTLTYKFNKPAFTPISRAEFSNYKQRQAMGIHFEFLINRSASEEFAGELSFLKKCFVVTLLFGVLSFASDICAAIACIAFLLFCVCGISYLGMISSFKSAVKKENLFYKKLRDAILSSSYYEEFQIKYFDI
jgi:hypothetical protein